jgi:hypothetical protein
MKILSEQLLYDGVPLSRVKRKTTIVLINEIGVIANEYFCILNNDFNGRGLAG